MSEHDIPTARVPQEEQAGTSPQAGATESAPPFPPPVAGAAEMLRDGPPPVFASGKCIHGFEIQRLLGSGSFARVYLARQIALDRLVALKVSANQGTEARTLAHLEHDHIVQVFTDVPDPVLNLRFLCMQFVPGLALDRIIAELNKRDPATWNGQTFIDIIDLLCAEPVTFDLAGINNRAALQGFDQAELACWMGARLAQALAHAHDQGIIHRDIKPANILVNRYGRPFLADFNIALNSSTVAPGGDETFGGTLSYMAPEHLDAFNPASGVGADVVDARSDVYSLGLVLFVLLTGRGPFKGRAKVKISELLNTLAQERRAGAPSPRQLRPEVPELLDRQVRRCLDPEPSRRFQSAADLTRALEGCRELQQMEKATARLGRAMRWCKSRPFMMLFVLAVIPQVLGTAVSIAYNQIHIVADLSPDHLDSFLWIVIGYNGIVWPILVPILALLVRRTMVGVRRLQREVDMPVEDAARIRRAAMALPMWTVFLSAVGWFTGGIAFPAGLELLAGPVTTGRVSIYLLFLVSFVLSGLIASTYSYFGVQFVVLCELYPRLWSNPAEAGQQAQKELPRVVWHLFIFQILAGLIPVGGACLLIVAAAGERLTVSYCFLLLSLLVVGGAGVVLATMVANRLEKVIQRT
jgi:serine/threonine protein kinase